MIVRSSVSGLFTIIMNERLFGALEVHLGNEQCTIGLQTNCSGMTKLQKAQPFTFDNALQHTVRNGSDFL